jgi:hypothetical protein
MGIIQEIIANPGPETIAEVGQAARMIMSVVEKVEGGGAPPMGPEMGGGMQQMGGAMPQPPGPAMA